MAWRYSGSAASPASSAWQRASRPSPRARAAGFCPFFQPVQGLTCHRQFIAADRGLDEIGENERPDSQPVVPEDGQGVVVGLPVAAEAEVQHREVIQRRR